ncbi:MAG: hypothetical protein J7M19_04515 [Planctomycetes bacterium]|nr:hypothetical protein [Planctomycetota bacterium]
MKRRFKLTAVIFLILAAAIPSCLGASSDRFEELMAEARSYDVNRGGGRHSNRDRAVETYWKAIAERPGHPKNVDIEFHIGQLLAYIVDPPNNQSTRIEDAAEVFAGIVERYPKSNTFVVRSSILAGDCSMAKGDRPAAKRYYKHAVDGLAEAFINRKRDSGDPNADDFDLFNERNRHLFTVAVGQYVHSIGPRGSLERLHAYEDLAKEFPGTPFERIADKNAAIIREKTRTATAGAERTVVDPELEDAAADVDVAPDLTDKTYETSGAGPAPPQAPQESTAPRSAEAAPAYDYKRALWVLGAASAVLALLAAAWLSRRGRL